MAPGGEGDRGGPTRPPVWIADDFDAPLPPEVAAAFGAAEDDGDEE